MCNIADSRTEIRILRSQLRSAKDQTLLLRGTASFCAEFQTEPYYAQQESFSEVEIKVERSPVKQEPIDDNNSLPRIRDLQAILEEWQRKKRAALARGISGSMSKRTRLSSH